MTMDKAGGGTKCRKINRRDQEKYGHTQLEHLQEGSGELETQLGRNAA
jgi:hypothetical protein